ncbi:MAG TPA: Ig-like domain-containing protein [Candidatus Paceibacterota bacterium]
MTSFISRIAALVLLLTFTVGLATAAFAESGGPTVTLTSTTSSSTSASSIPITATFSEIVTGLASTSLAVTNATIANFTGSSTTFTFTLLPAATGTASVMIPAGVATSSATNKSSQASNKLSFTRSQVALPAISGITATSTASTTARVRFTTNIATFGKIEYGTTTAYTASTTRESTASTTHTISLSKLKPATKYHFRVNATDATGKIATSSDQTFTTLSASSTASTTASTTATTTPLAVTSVSAVQASGVANDSFGNGWHWILHLTIPVAEQALRIRFTDFIASTGSGTIPAKSNIRIHTPQSSNAASSSAAIMAKGIGFSEWLYLTSDTSTTTPGIQADLNVEVKIPHSALNGSYSTTYTVESLPKTATSTAATSTSAT